MSIDSLSERKAEALSDVRASVAAFAARTAPRPLAAIAPVFALPEFEQQGAEPEALLELAEALLAVPERPEALSEPAEALPVERAGLAEA